MADDDDGMILNLKPYTPKIPPVAKPISKNLSKEKHNDNSLVPNKGEKVKKKTKPTSSGSRKYIDPKDFTPISTLFNKNPDIPTVPDQDVSGKCQEIVFTSDNVSDLLINSRLKSNLRDQFKFETLTKIQKLSLPKLLAGKDVLIKSPTGSGKTMCYAVPIIEKLTAITPNVSRADGPYAIVLVPTRELAFQTFTVLQELCKSCISIVPGMLIGGEKCKSEKGRLRKGINIVIATPGRLNYHLKETSCFDVSRVLYLVLDEADRLLDMGFEKTVKEITNELNKHGSVSRQSVLLSATLTPDIQTLASLTLHDPAFIDSEVDDARENVDKDFVVPSSLQQYFVTVPAKLRLVCLFSFIIKNAFVNKHRSKLIVFLSSINSVVLSYDLLKIAVENYFHLDLSVIKFIHMLHGDMDQASRLEAFNKFKASDFGILLCTDVGARGLDIKNVDWIVQYSCPTQIEDYLHRVGRTARIGEKGKSLLFVMPSEIEYISVLAKSSVALEELKLFDILSYLKSDKKIMKSSKMEQQIEEEATKLQASIEEAILKSDGMLQKAVEAFKSYIQSYATYPSNQKYIFHVKHLHLGHVAKSFGLREAPKKFSASAPNLPMKRKEKFEEEKFQKEKARSKKLKRDEELADGIFSGPRPGKQKFHANFSRNKNAKKKQSSKRTKIRI